MAGALGSSSNDIGSGSKNEMADDGDRDAIMARASRTMLRMLSGLRESLAL